MKPLVSILIPAYNAEPWIAYAINSALRQTWSPKEIIVVDDGSRDSTLGIAEKFSRDGVDVVSQENRGAAAARNNAFSRCRGDYVQWLDADDVLAPDKISRQMEFVESSRNKRLLLSSEWGKFLYRTRSARFVPTSIWEDLAPSEWLVRKMSQNIWMQPGTWLVSRELTEAAGPWDERLSFDDDGEYFCRVLLKSEAVKFIPHAKTFYRTTPGSLSEFDRSNKKLESAWISMRLHVQYLRQLEDSPRTRRAGLIYLQTWLPSFHPYRPDIVQGIQELAGNLGGEAQLLKILEPLRWKFAWMKNIFGQSAAYRAQTCLPQFKHFALRHWEKTIFQLEKLTQPEL